MRRSFWIGLGVVPVAAAVLALGVVLRAVPPAGLRSVGVGASPLALAVDPRTGYAFIIHSPRSASSNVGTVSIVDTRNATLLRAVGAGLGPSAISIDARNGRVVVANGDGGNVSVFDSRDGRLLRTIAVGRHPYSVVADPQTDRTFVVNTLDDTVSVVDTRHAVVLHSVPIPHVDAIAGVGVDARGGHVVIAGSATMMVLDARSGRVLRTIALTTVAVGVALDQRTGNLFVTQGTGLSMLDLRSGRMLRTIALGGNPGPVAVDARRGRVAVVNSNVDDTGTPRGLGSVSVVDVRSGRVLRRQSVGVAPNAVAVDEGTGRIIVVNAGGSVSSSDAWAQVPEGLRRWLPFLPRPGTTMRTEPSSVTILDAVG